jgi:uridine phosphorylase
MDANKVETSEGIQYHIKAKTGDFSDIVLLPGDPKRSELIAKSWDSFQKIAEYRQFVSYRGKYANVDISTISTGIGPSACEIAITELKNIGVRSLIRVGSCGALQEDIELGDLVISEAAVRLEDTSNQYVRKEYPAVASRKITEALIRACEENNLSYHVGITASSSSFYVGQGRSGWNDYLPSHQKHLIEDLTKANVLNFEMEASLIFVLGSLYRMLTGTICAVFANRPRNEFQTIGMDKAIIAANEAVRILSE